jgi:hypothetical protein
MDPKNIIAQLIIKEQQILKQQNELKQKQIMNTLQKAEQLTITKVNEIQVNMKQQPFTLLKPSTTFCVGIQNQDQPTNQIQHKEHQIRASTSHLFWRPAPTSTLHITEPHTLPGSLTVYEKGKITIGPNRYITFKNNIIITITPNKFMEYKQLERPEITNLKTKMKNNIKIINALKYEINKNNLHELNKKMAEKIQDLKAITGKQKGFANKFAIMHKKYQKLKREAENEDERLKKMLNIIDKSHDKAGTLAHYLYKELQKLIGQFQKYRENVNNTNKKIKDKLNGKDSAKEKFKRQVKEELENRVNDAKLEYYKDKIKKCEDNLQKLEQRWDLTQEQYDNMKKNVTDTKIKTESKRKKIEQNKAKQLKDKIKQNSQRMHSIISHTNNNA